jgi:hypothetical protein
MNLSIGTKLLLAFLFVATIALAIGGIREQLTYGVISAS